MKYKINKEFFPYSKLKPPINRPMISLAQKVMRPPRFFFKDPILKIDTIHFQSFDNAVLQSFVISPLSIKK